jgi:hypothetical protein
VIGYRVNPLVANAAAELRTRRAADQPSGTIAFTADSIEAHESFGDEEIARGRYQLAMPAPRTRSSARWPADEPFGNE